MDRSINILLVDDHQMVLDGLVSMLKDENTYNIAQANDGSIALDLILSDPAKYQLVISDITMPGMNGIDLCKKIKSDYGTIKVLILSMHNTLNYLKEVITAEADGYILKNIGQKEFKLSIERVLENGTYFSQELLPLLLNREKKPDTKDYAKPTLTHRELEILLLIVQELTSKEIAEKLFISKQTVDTHRLNLMQKTNSKSIVGLIKFAIQEHLVDID